MDGGITPCLNYIFIFHIIGDGSWRPCIQHEISNIKAHLLSDRAGSMCLDPRSADSAGEQKNRGPTMCTVEGYVADGVVSVRREDKLLMSKHSCNLIMNN